MENCLFCKIIKGEIPSSKIYEDKNTFAFLDISPVNKGHALIIPKMHSETILDMDDEDAANLIKTIKKISKAVMTSTNADGFNIMMNNYKASGQIIPHAHFHIIPRFENDGLKHWPQGKYFNDEADIIKNKIIDELSD